MRRVAVIKMRYESNALFRAREFQCVLVDAAHTHTHTHSIILNCICKNALLESRSLQLLLLLVLLLLMLQLEKGKMQNSSSHQILTTSCTWHVAEECHAH